MVTRQQLYRCARAPLQIVTSSFNKILASQKFQISYSELDNKPKQNHLEVF
jgi:hypothetical protein